MHGSVNKNAHFDVSIIEKKAILSN
jgi:hypothetical protein